MPPIHIYIYSPLLSMQRSTYNKFMYVCGLVHHGLSHELLVTIHVLQFTHTSNVYPRHTFIVLYNNVGKSQVPLINLPFPFLQDAVMVNFYSYESQSLLALQGGRGILQGLTLLWVLLQLSWVLLQLPTQCYLYQLSAQNIVACMVCVYHRFQGSRGIKSSRCKLLFISGIIFKKVCTSGDLISIDS